MGMHVTARLAWHSDGWNGHICSEPHKNTYCVGTHSYPGEMITQRRDLENERACAGQSCAGLKEAPPCIYSVNAFGEEQLTSFADPPEFFNKGAKRRTWTLQPSTVCVWPYEEMYRDEVRKGPSYDARERKKHSDAFFAQIEAKSSLIFYYANYSNPFSTDETPRYVLVGLSRVKEVGEELYFDGCDERTMERYGGYVWDRNVTSSYPEEGLRLPYHRYKDDPRIERFAVFPENPLLCKYGSKLMTDDDALGLVEQFHQAVLALIEIGDRSENWQARRTWLEGIISELWKRRGAYPGMAEACVYLQLHEAVPYLKSECSRGRETAAVDAIWAVIDGTTHTLGGKPVATSVLNATRRSWKLLEPDAQILLKTVLARLDIDAHTMSILVTSPSLQHALYARTRELVANPYLLAEQYIGSNADERISWSKLDRAALPSPELGVPPLVGLDSAERLRALAVECLQRVSGHTFLEQQTLTALMNARLESTPEWKRVAFRTRYFEVDEETYSGALFFLTDNECNYIYLRTHREAEEHIGRQIKTLIQRPDVQLRVPMTDANWRDLLFNSDSSLATRSKTDYEAAIATQAATCGKIFLRGFAVLCGAAGTGKTTVLASIVKAIRKIDGIGTAIIALAPTGKAADRARDVLASQVSSIGGAVQTETIHAFLNRNAWLNDNLTFRRQGNIASEYQTVIIDESSMIDLHLAATLFRAINWNSVKRLILVGDPNQLPPIGTGRVFADIVDYCREHAPESVAELTVNLRQMENRAQGEGTGIIDLAGLYRRQTLADEKDEDKESAAEDLLRRVQESGDVDKDLRVLYWQEPEELAPLLLERMTIDMAQTCGKDPQSTAFHTLWTAAFNWQPEHAQVLSPYRGELYGFEALNLAVQQHKSGGLIKRMGMIDGITLFDKVIQTRNRTSSDPIYAFENGRVARCDVFNGELGFVGPHGFDKDRFKHEGFRMQRFAVKFARKGDVRVNYGRELGHFANSQRPLPDQKVKDNLELGYAISVHKAQGSEFERIYVVIPAARRQLLSQELLYTALTRGKKHCTLLVQRDAGVLVDMRRRERCWLDRINSSLLGWHVAPQGSQVENGWYEAGKVHQTLSHDMVRSKSEVIIANMLYERGITFFYEEPLFAPDGTMYLPDFTLLYGGEKYYWEHVGRIRDPAYVQHWREKQAWYERHFPGRLKITYERSPGLAPGAPAAPLDVSVQADELIRSF